MQISLHSDTNTDRCELMTEHLHAVVKAALGRFGARITRVDAHLSDVQSKTAAGDIHCTLEARLVGADAVVVKGHAGNAHQAIEGAVRKLKRTVAIAPRSLRSQQQVPAADAAGDGPG